MILVTHYQRMLGYVVPDRVHVLSGAASSCRAARSSPWSWRAGAYSWLEKDPAAGAARSTVQGGILR